MMPQETPEERRFHVLVSGVITELLPGPGNSPAEEKPFANDAIEYHDMSYVDIVVIEQIYTKHMNAMRDDLADLGAERVKYWLEQGGSADQSKVRALGKFEINPDN